MKTVQQYITTIPEKYQCLYLTFIRKDVFVGVSCLCLRLLFQGSAAAQFWFQPPLVLEIRKKRQDALIVTN